jgi:putative transposase
VTAELPRRGWRVERLMAAHGIVGHRPRRRRSLTKPNTAEPPAPDLVGDCLPLTSRTASG